MQNEARKSIGGAGALHRRSVAAVAELHVWWDDYTLNYLPFGIAAVIIGAPRSSFYFSSWLLDFKDAIYLTHRPLKEGFVHNFQLECSS